MVGEKVYVVRALLFVWASTGALCGMGRGLELQKATILFPESWLKQLTKKPLFFCKETFEDLAKLVYDELVFLCRSYPENICNERFVQYQHDYFNEHSPVLIAAIRNKPCLLKFLVTQCSESINVATSCEVIGRRDTPLHGAAFSGSTECARILIQHKADVNAQTDKALTAIMIAARQGNMALVEMLAQAGATLFREGSMTTALHEACGAFNVDIVKFLLTSTPVDAKNIHDQSPLKVALDGKAVGQEQKDKKKETILVLLEAGAQIDDEIIISPQYQKHIAPALALLKNKRLLESMEVEEEVIEKWSDDDENVPI